MQNNSVLIITNDNEKGKQISSKIKLLRECDTVKIYSYLEVISALNTNQPSLILIYCADNDSVEIVNEIRSINSLNEVPILLILESKDDEKLFSAFDYGIDDFVFTDESDSVILMRILFVLQKSVLYKQMKTLRDILIEDNIIDKNTNLYTTEKAPIVLRNLFGKIIEEDNQNSIFMYLKAVRDDNGITDIHNIANIISNVLRGNDAAAFAKEAGFYLVLNNAGEEGALAVLHRIQEQAGEDYGIYACAADIFTAFEEIEPIMYRTLKEQISVQNEFVFLDKINLNNLLNVISSNDEDGEAFKTFKKEFLNNFEKIVAPVFYQIQNTNTERFPQALISYYINENESTFTIKQNKVSAELRITYPSYTKIIIDIKHLSESKTSNIKRLTFDFEDFSQERLTMVLEDMMSEYSENVNIKLIQDETKNGN